MKDKITAKQLIQMLKYRRRYKREDNTIKKNIALELAHTGEKDAVEELISMINTHYSYKRHWKTFWRSDAIRFYGGELNNQLIAIEALGETKSPEALRCLETFISNPTEYKEEQLAGWDVSWNYDGYCTERPVYGIAKKACFANMHWIGGLEAAFTARKLEGYNEWASKKPEYQMIINSINKLKDSLSADKGCKTKELKSLDK